MSEIEQDKNVARAAKLETATLSDALDRLGLNGQCSRIKPRDPSFRMAGRAFTILYGPAASPAGTVGDFIDDVPPGSVIVLDNGGRTDATVWGDILTEIAHRRGIAGTVIDGINRDVHLCLSLGYPVFSRDNWMRTGKDRVQVEATNVPVNIGDVRVAPGDLLRGDADGVISIPKEHEERVLAAAEEIDAAERAIRAAVASGMRLDEARKQFKYHQLQTRATGSKA
ncbi:4-hydroxy-4-methyl-2-oxoglutarate aldolase [Paraburkholderia atlantica]|uniref:Putative 4-hydroxy-4-methyl-2-oxoglutarate aldolase n=1 Tax=Paraburkholderia atlantica TaxID=2654982 RepID=D5WJM2_PARAM|nr:RraA family protein [Paraburkholderia atlantica]ADG18667.1 Dimethylmenaquinone methyltransferase [Paraburkholderia atlantica]MBB5420871.1 regulator of RNase E activity RraA [Paraburkholderia atlantica]MBB5423343.1 regulator of RNase E activity RraA [Paraburkholderia atlantica]MBB5504901.1 regulator of RNase E activity RraA [Paraburkholderia atlantica]MPW10230.1 RraA family protein [Paraburkholderia atlantica]